MGAVMTRAYYLWARRQVSGELDLTLDAVKSLRTPLASHFLHIMGSLSQGEKGVIWRALLKRFHPDGSKAAGDAITQEEQAAIQRFDTASTSLFAALEPDEVTEGVASRRQLMAAAEGALEPILKVRPERLGGGVRRYVTEHRNAVVETHLDASSRHFQLCYWHHVRDRSGRELRRFCSQLEWLGISSQTYWFGVTEDAIAPITVSISAAVRGFLDFCEADWGSP